MYNNIQSVSMQLNQCRQIVQQLIHQTQHSSVEYERMMQQEMQNAQLLEQLAQRERQAAQTIAQVLQGHHVGMQQMRQIEQACNQIEREMQASSPAVAGFYPQISQGPTMQQ
ncbi:hypothetical protein [Alicyclobacillus fastidiosus]|uniref:AMP-dependent synthetase and ligase n=1 Tax=Alicyclobacillus fastidiosus TaxID=392011 RepID=A0ABV5AB97_9BACL|nr:hypothetical protein [Alicyclobacillus fastidiosus]WEH10479.1 hypothetical protein PYS47_04420 [Alicyclobacillus fastidiosus]